MTKKDLEKRIEELEELINHQKRLIDQLQIQIDFPTKQNVIDSCPNGGVHEYVENGTAGTQCKKCFKRLDLHFPSIIC
jgi:hypothetical protein